MLHMPPVHNNCLDIHCSLKDNVIMVSFSCDVELASSRVTLYCKQTFSNGLFKQETSI